MCTENSALRSRISFRGIISPRKFLMKSVGIMESATRIRAATRRASHVRTDNDLGLKRNTVVACPEICGSTHCAVQGRTSARTCSTQRGTSRRSIGRRHAQREPHLESHTHRQSADGSLKTTQEVGIKPGISMRGVAGRDTFAKKDGLRV